jgi:hypothetical protein
METEKDSGEDQPSAFRPTPILPDLLSESKGSQYQRGKHHSIDGNDQGRRVTELDKDRGRRGCRDPDEKKKNESNHTAILKSIRTSLQVSRPPLLPEAIPRITAMQFRSNVI